MQTYLAPSGLLFTLGGSEPYTRKAGTSTRLDVWSSSCRHPGCSAQFVVKVPADSDPANSKAFGRVHCDAHKLTPAEATQRWVESCRRANTRATPEVLSVIYSAADRGSPPADIALLVPLKKSRIYSILANRKKNAQ